VTVQAVDALVREHDDLPPDIHARAEEHLLALAPDFDAAALQRLGNRLFEVVCSEAADAAEGDILARQEEHARRTACLTMHDNRDGTVEGRFRIPVLHAALLKKALERLTSPRRLGQGRLDPTTGRKLPDPVLLGQGFMELLENHLHPAHLPSTGNSPFTLVITMSLDALITGLGTAALETGHRISAGEARRWPAPQASSRWSSTGSPPRWTSAASNGCSTRISESRWPSSTAAAPRPTVIDRLHGPRHITDDPRRTAAPPTSPTDFRCAHLTQDGRPPRRLVHDHPADRQGSLHATARGAVSQPGGGTAFSWQPTSQR
jgi:hypothetical protein